MATPHRLRHHVGVFRSVFAYMHEAMVAAYVRDATLAPMDDETPAPYVAPWLVVCILSSAMMLSGELPAHPPKACSPNLALLYKSEKTKCSLLGFSAVLGRTTSEIRFERTILS
jgi:hypothetical protein